MLLGIKTYFFIRWVIYHRHFSTIKVVNYTVEFFRFCMALRNICTKSSFASWTFPACAVTRIVFLRCYLSRFSFMEIFSCSIIFSFSPFATSKHRLVAMYKNTPFLYTLKVFSLERSVILDKIIETP